MTNIACEITVKGPNGCPVIDLTGENAYNVEVEAYDLIKVTLPAKKRGPAKTKLVYLQPGNADSTYLMVVTSSIYHECITYNSTGIVEEEGSHILANTHPLDGPLVLMGRGAVDWFKETPAMIYFQNDLCSDVEIQILVGRAASAVV